MAEKEISKNAVSKSPIIDEIKANAEKASSAIRGDYCGLTVAEDTELRKALREAGVKYKVYKNTFMKRAFEGTDFAKLDDALNAPSAVAFSYEDATAAARVIDKFAKAHADKITMKAGVVEGDLYAEADLKKLAAIPSREVLISKLLGSMKSPISTLARVLKQIAEKDATAAE